MSEKDEALRFDISFSEANFQILRVTNSGEFIWNENADQMMRDPVFIRAANHASIHVLRALRQAEFIRKENERLTKANDELAKVNVDNLIRIGRLRDAHQKVLEWVDVIKRSYREEQRAKETRGDAHANIEKISEQWLR
jgi:hypothetical protein